MITKDIETRKRVAAWINGSSRDFHSGIGILTQSGFKPGVVRKLARVGDNAPDAKVRLTHLMREFLSVFGGVAPEDTDAELHVFNGQESPADHPDEKSMAILAVAARQESGKEQLPERIGAVIHEYSQLYKNRDRMCRLMAEMPEDNGEETMEKRKELSDGIEAATSRMEVLYPLYEKYLSMREDISEEDMDSSAKKDADTDSGNENLPDNSLEDPLQRKSIDELKAIRKNLSVKRTRARNMLLYQKETRQAEENPMPESPARVKYTNKVAALDKQIEDIDYAIARLTT